MGLTAHEVMSIIKKLNRMSLADLFLMSSEATKLYRARVKKEEIRLIKQFKVGDVVRFHSRKGNADIAIKIIKKTGRKILGQEVYGHCIWTVSPIICKKSEES
jgi:hypothetical protein